MGKNINKNNIFSFDSDNLGRIIKQISKKGESAEKDMDRKMKQAVGMVYAIAHQKRPMITQAEAKTQGRKYLGKGKYARVSDPDAELGVPVASGALQISIEKEVTHKGTKTIGRIWTDSPYGPYVEYGTSRMRARPFIRPAYDLTIDAIKKLFKNK